MANNNIAKIKALVVDDQKNIRTTITMSLKDHATQIDTAGSLAEANQMVENSLSNSFYDVVLLDISLRDGKGITVLEKIATLGYARRVIMISGEGTTHDAISATQLGAFDYIEKPFSVERLLVSVERCLDYNNLEKTNKRLIKRLDDTEITGQSASILKLKTLITKVASTNSRVLIVGESGTGKELVARAIHNNSQRQDKQMIKVNCAAIPASIIESELFGHTKGAFTGAHKSRKGMFELAHNSTLFLDEISELDISLQAKLLRVLQSGEIQPVGSETTTQVDVRILAASNRNLTQMIKEGSFREDLYYRLNVISLTVPPLCERQEDIPLLAQKFLEEICQQNGLPQMSLAASVLKELKNYHWPGNVRELKNMLESSVVLADKLEITQISQLKHEALSSASSALQPKNHDNLGKKFVFSCNILTWKDFQKKIAHSYLNFILENTNANVTKAAQKIALERAYFHRLMKKLSIKR